MNSVEIKVDNKVKRYPVGITTGALFKSSENDKYDDNPVVASIVQGELKSLSYHLNYDAEVSPIYLFSSLGKRVYRHSICFLLSYASSLLYNDDQLLIRHSLGDGFLFTFINREVSEDDVIKLADLMKKTAADNLPIEKLKMTQKEAKERLSIKTHPETLKLLETNNESVSTFFSLNSFIDTSYEALVPNTGILTLWELRKYDNGLLLRYPQERSFLELKEFTDNSVLYETLKTDGYNCHVLGVESIGDLNEKIIKGESNRLIELSEAMLNRSIGLAASRIKKNSKIRFVLIAGPSSSGKTTSSLKLCSQLEILGYKPIKISLDDYYLPVDDIPKDKYGRTDFEALEALNLPLFREQMEELQRGEDVHLMKYSFKTRERKKEDKITKLEDNSIVVVEGIHGLNPSLLPNIDKEEIFRIYISALTTVNIDDHNRISTTDNRIIRRVVRDARTRGISATETLSMWHMVENGEKNHIFPYQNNADVMINSALCYELAVLAPKAINELRSVQSTSTEAYTLARCLLKFLNLFYTIPSEQVPSDSVLREFIGGSIYGAI